MTFGFQGAATMPLLVQMVILAALSGPATLAQPQSASILRAQYPTVAMLPSMHELPDPLLMLDGRRVTSREQWIKERRPELIGPVSALHVWGSSAAAQHRYQQTRA